MTKVKLDKRLLGQFECYSDLELKEYINTTIVKLTMYQKASDVACEIIKMHGFTYCFNDDKWYEIYKLRQLAVLRNIKIDVNLEEIMCSKEDVIEVLNDFASNERLYVDEHCVDNPDKEIEVINIKYSKIIRWVMENDIIPPTDGKTLKKRLK